jgi:hypothetical protein
MQLKHPRRVLAVALPWLFVAALASPLYVPTPAYGTAVYRALPPECWRWWDIIKGKWPRYQTRRVVATPMGGP